MAGHPLEPFLQALVTSPMPGPSPLAPVLDQFNTLTLEPDEQRAVQPEYHRAARPQRRVSRVEEKNSDHVVRDLSMRVRNASERRGSPDVASARLLLAVSPHSQYARGMLIEHDWEHAKRTWRNGKRKPPVRRRCWAQSLVVIKPWARPTTPSGCFPSTSSCRPTSGPT